MLRLCWDQSLLCIHGFPLSCATLAQNRRLNNRFIIANRLSSSARCNDIGCLRRTFFHHSSARPQLNLRIFNSLIVISLVEAGCNEDVGPLQSSPLLSCVHSFAIFWLNIRVTFPQKNPVKYFGTYRICNY